MKAIMLIVTFFTSTIQLLSNLLRYQNFKGQKFEILNFNLSKNSEKQ